MAALASKLGFIVILAMFFEPAEVGLFGLIVATVNLSLYFIGMDFFVYANREFRISDPAQRQNILSQIGYLFGISYILLIPAYVLVFWFELLPWPFFFFAVTLAILEHLSTELYRLLIICDRPVLASLSLFIRLGFWPLLVAGTMWLFYDARTLSTIMYFWVFGAILSIAVPAAIHAKQIRSFSVTAVDWRWIRAGLKITLPFLFGTLCLRSIQTLDRFLLIDLVGADILGAFVFYASLASLIPAMLQAGVYAFSMPKLVSIVHNKNWEELSLKMRSLRREIAFSAVILSIGIIVASHLVLLLIDKPVYQENYVLLYFAIAGNCLFAASMYFHLALYAMRKDRALAASHILALMSFLIATAITAYFSGYYAVPTGIVIAFLMMLLMKSRLYVAALKEAEVRVAS